MSDASINGVVGVGSTSREAPGPVWGQEWPCHGSGAITATWVTLLCLWCGRELHQGWAWLLSSLSLPGRYPQSNNLIGLWAVVQLIPKRLKAASGIIFYSALLKNAKTLNTALRKIILSLCIVVMPNNHCLSLGSCHGGAGKNTSPHPVSEP